jgi:hypothetical protein
MVDVVFSWAYFATGPAGKSEIHANCWCSLLGSDCTNNWHPQILHNKRFSSHETGNNFSIKAATPIDRAAFFICKGDNFLADITNYL